MFRKGFYKGWLTEKALIQLRKEIVLGSVFLHDYENSFGISKTQVCVFFDSYVEYIWEEMKETGVEDETRFNEFDNDHTLIEWYRCYETNPFTKFEN